MGRKIVGTTLQAKHHLALVRLVKGDRPQDVARDMGFDVSTIYAWQKWPLFQERAAQYAESMAREALDRGLEDAQVELRQSTTPIINWMRDIVLGVTELKDKNRWRMALDFLHHAGILDQQSVAKAASNPAALMNFNLDQRKQTLAVGNADLEEKLKNFRSPRQVIDG